MTRSSSGLQRCMIGVVVCLGAVSLVLTTGDVALAAPGGIIKQAARSFWGRLILYALAAILAPLILWIMVKRAILIRRTRKKLRELARDVPHFDWMRLKERITNVFHWVHSGWDQEKMELASDYTTGWYWQNQQLRLDRWEREGVKNVTSDISIKSITPLYLAHDPEDPESDRIVVEIKAEMRDYLVDRDTGKVVKGDKTLDTLSTVWSFVRPDGAWVLTMIEEADSAFEYLSEPDLLPVPTSEPQPVS